MDSQKNRETILNELKKFSNQSAHPKTESKTVSSNREELYNGFSLIAGTVGATVRRVKNKDEALASLADILVSLNAGSAVISNDNLVTSAGIEFFLKSKDIKVTAAKDKAIHRNECFSSDVGITGANYALADTGSLVIKHSTENERLTSLAPPVHIALVDIKNILPDIDSLVSDTKVMPSAMTLITGPSMTADIALTATLGMHGPRALHIIVIG